MGDLVSTLVTIVISLAISLGLFVGFNKVIDQGRSEWGWFTGFIGAAIGLIAGAALQHNGWLKLGPDGPDIPLVGQPLKEGWLTIVLAGALGAAAGYLLGKARNRSLTERTRSEQRWRPAAFVGPAVAFVALGLIFPSLRTMLLSFQERDSEGESGGATLANYDAIFDDPNFFNIESFDRIFTSRLFIVGLAAVVVAGIAAFATAQELSGTKVARSATATVRTIGIALAVLGALAVAGLVEAIVRSPVEAARDDGSTFTRQNPTWIYDNILTPIVSSQITLWVLVAAFFAGGLAFVVNARTVNVPQALRSGSKTLPVVAAISIAVGAITAATGALSGAEGVSLILLGAGIALLWAVTTTNHENAALDLGAPSSSIATTAGVIFLLLAVFSTLQSVLWNNLWWVVTVTGLSTILGLLLAILADRSRGDTAARTMIFLPMAISMVGAAVIWDFMYELQASGNQTGLINAILQGIGFEARGFFINSSMIPWNNFWIMLIMVWIQTGFAMVVLSSAIKGVPDDLLEAARTDGATEVQTFWRIIIPQIRTTIIVVVTTLIIMVMKVFDLVKATTGGANSTNVLANEMFDQLRDRNFPLSSAFAVLIFVLTLPVMIYNVRRNAEEMAS